MIAPKTIGLVRSPFGFALWNNEEHEISDVDERYVRASDCAYLLSIIDSAVEAAGVDLVDPDDRGTIEQIRCDLAAT